MVALVQQTDLSEALADLAGALEALEIGPDEAVMAADRDRLAGTIRSYLMPRAIDPTTPMAVVVAGPTGSGKSTLINSLSGIEVSRTGALRPTTLSPVVLAAQERARDYEMIGGVPCHVVSGRARILETIVLVDTPDIDSTSKRHRAMAETLIDNADVVVFVTSALRYADEVPWHVLRRAVSRGTPVIHVLNRVASASAGAIGDYRSRLSAAGLEDALVTVPEHHLAGRAQSLPSLAVLSLRKRIDSVVAGREEFAGKVFERVLHSTVSQVEGLARSISEMADETEAIGAELSIALADRSGRVDLTGLGDGLYPTLPTRPSRRAVRRWRRLATRVAPEKVRDLKARVVDRLVSVVESDVRHWLVGEHAVLQQHDIEPADVATEVRSTTRSAAERWIGFVARIVTDHREEVWPGQAVLIDAATCDEEVPAVAVLFGEDGPELVERARRELVGRLELVYEQAGDLVVMAMRRRHVDSDDEELRTSLGAVSSTPAPVHA